MTIADRSPDALASAQAPRKSRALLIVLAALTLALFLLFVSLGTWQLERRAWKLDLIARVDQRVVAPVVPAPARSRWTSINAVTDEYRHVQVVGTFLNEAETLVQAVTVLGAGYWVMTPLRAEDGTTVLVNRGFVPPERRERAAHGADAPGLPASVTGLLRLTEPGGAFLRRNDGAHAHWFSRDVAAIAATRGLRGVAPYFIDADADTGASRSTGSDQIEPTGGLTVVAFHNNHLVYAITWYLLAMMVAAGAWRVVKEERRLRLRTASAPADSRRDHPTGSTMAPDRSTGPCAAHD